MNRLNWAVISSDLTVYMYILFLELVVVIIWKFGIQNQILLEIVVPCIHSWQATITPDVKLFPLAFESTGE